MDLGSSSSTSFSESKPQFTHDVFINFWGEEMGRKFVSHLYYALSDSDPEAKVNIFLDDENRDKGIEEQDLILQAIEGSKIALVVFTKSYVESTWCLDELLKIIECHHAHGLRVIPVFYEINPSVVRDQKGDFGIALRSAAEEKGFSGERLEYALSSWSRALTEAANFIGWKDNNFRNDAGLVEGIYHHVLGKLRLPRDTENTLPGDLVGLKFPMKKVIALIENQSTKVCSIGIWGMVGSGKSTIARAIYNRLRSRFVNTSFLSNIRAAYEQGRHTTLQKQLLGDVLNTKVNIQSVEIGTIMIKNRLPRKRALIVLDDVDAFCQLEDILCGNPEWFGQGTVIIITTTDLHLLNRFKVDYVYKMEELDDNESLELFSLCTFKEAKPRQEFNELARNAVACCGGLPLALKVYGSSLRGKSMELWESHLSNFKDIPNNNVHSVLKLSFDNLDDMEKDIFLDICCFFIGKNKAYVTEILNGCGLCADTGIRVLIDRTLIKVDQNNKLQMHPLLQQMGREIIRQESVEDLGRRSRLWFHEEVVEVLTMNIGTETVEGLTLTSHLSNTHFFETSAFKEMKRLRLLKLDNVQLTGDYRYLSKQLRWICLRGFPSKYIPNEFNLEGVIAIELKYSNLRQLWSEPQVLQWLKILNLSHSKYLTETPDFSELPNLEKLILKDCPSLCKVHQSIGDVNNLQLINLKDCTSLNNLPREIYKLKSLKIFIVSGCSKIDILEEDILQMESLIALFADFVVKQVPFSIVSSKGIGHISPCDSRGLSCNIFPSIIRFWMSPTMNDIHPFRATPSSLVSRYVDNNNWDDLVPLLRSFSDLRSVTIQCDTEFQLRKQARTILDDICDQNLTELEISTNHIKYYCIGIGDYQEVFNTLSHSISETLTTSESCGVFLPSDNDPNLLAFMGEGHSVCFTVPEDSRMMGMILCVVYLSVPEIIATECLTCLLIVNYTKCIIQIYRQNTVISFNNIDWQGIVSHVGAGDKVEIFVSFGHGLVVKKTIIYVMNGESIDMAPKENESVDMAPRENALIRFIKKIIMCDFW